MHCEMEAIEARRLLTVLAAIDPQTGLLSINGDGADNVIVVSRNAAGTILVNAGAIPVIFGPATVTNTTRIDIRGFTGNDNLSVNESNGVMPRTDMSGNEGNDTLLGGSKVEVINGNDGDDFIDGRGGDDALNGEAGNDTFVWNPGGGSDFIQAGLDSDTIRFEGSNGNETLELFNDDGFFSIARNLGTTALLIQDLETVNVAALGGQDVVNVRDLTATGVTNVTIDLAGPLGTPDGLGDSVLVEGSGGDNLIRLSSTGTTDFVNGAAAAVTILSADARTDALTVNGLTGNDVIRVDSPSTTTALTLDGAAGNDTIFGGVLADVIFGGAGNDFAQALSGDDRVFLGDGDDTFQWHVPDDDDFIEGGIGNDLISMGGFSSPTSSETINVSANGPRLSLANVQAGDSVDADGFETVEVVGFAGAEQVTVNSLAGTAVTRVIVDLRTTIGNQPDGTADSVTVNADNAGNAINVTDGAAGTIVTGLAARVDVIRADAALDVLNINALGGIDTVTVNQAGATGAVRIVRVNGGTEHDQINALGTAADGAVTIVPSGGDDGVTVNDDSAGVANVVFDATQRIGSLTFREGARVRLSAGGSKVLTMTGIGLFGDGTLDLADNSMVFDYGTVSSINGFRSVLARGFNGGAWNGGGIISSAAAARPDTGIGFAEATDLFGAFPATFKGQSIDNTSIILSHTLTGDTDLNGTVNLTDFNRLAASFGGSGKRWSQGDFDYDGNVNLVDFNKLAANFGRTMASSAATGARDETTEGELIR